MHEGNLVYRKTARNFNPMMATAGKVTVAEVEELVPVGSIDPDLIHTPGIFVQRIVARRDVRKAHRKAHGERELTCPGRATTWPSSPRRNCATGSTSISASAFRRSWPTTFPTAWT